MAWLQSQVYTGCDGMADRQGSSGGAVLANRATCCGISAMVSPGATTAVFTQGQWAVVYSLR